MIAVALVAVACFLAGANAATLDDAIREKSGTVLFAGRAGSGRTTIIDGLLGETSPEHTNFAFQHDYWPLMVQPPRVHAFWENKLNLIETVGFGRRTAEGRSQTFRALDDAMELIQDCEAPLLHVYYVISAIERNAADLVGNLSALKAVVGLDIGERFSFVINKIDLDSNFALISEHISAAFKTVFDCDHGRILYMSKAEPITQEDLINSIFAASRIQFDVFCFDRELSLVEYQLVLRGLIAMKELEFRCYQKELERRAEKASRQLTINLFLEAIGAGLGLGARLVVVAVKPALATVRLTRMVKGMNAAFQVVRTVHTSAGNIQDSQNMSFECLTANMHAVLDTNTKLKDELHDIMNFVG